MNNPFTNFFVKVYSKNYNRCCESFYFIHISIYGAPGETRTPTLSHQFLRLACLPFHHKRIIGAISQNRTGFSRICSPAPYRPAQIASAGYCYPATPFRRVRLSWEQRLLFLDLDGQAIISDNHLSAAKSVGDSQVPISCELMVLAAGIEPTTS